MIYKKNILLLLLLLILPYTLIAESQQGFSIHCRLPGLKEGEKVTMWLYYDSGFKHEVSDSAYVKNGEFFIKGTVSSGPRLYWLRFEKSFDGNTGTFLPLFINNKENITIGSNNFEQYALQRKSVQSDLGNISAGVFVEGSPSNRAYQSLLMAQQGYQKYRGIFDNDFYELKRTIGFDGPLVERLLLDKNSIDDWFYVLYLRSQRFDLLPAVPFLVSTVYESGGRPAFLKRLYDSMPDSIKNTYYGQKMKSYAEFSNGQMFPEITLPTTEQENLSLKKVITNSRITVIQFWASNSSAVYDYQTKLKKYYQRYHPLGLSVIGISSDTSAFRWKRTAKGLPWYNVSDLKGRAGIVGQKFLEYGRSGTSAPNTTNVILDHNGKILAWDVAGPEIQWYLWHYLEGTSKIVSNRFITKNIKN